VSTTPRPNVFAFTPLDRSHRLRREEAAIAVARSHPEARVVPVWRSQSLVIAGEVPAAALPGLLDLAELAAHPEAAATLVLLGLRDGVPHFALDVSFLDEPSALPAFSGLGGEFVDLRQVGAVLPAEEGALLAYARAMMSWHRRSRFCGSCGAPTESRQGGHVRACTACGVEEFPRSDPAVIMLVHDGADRCLLARQASWPPRVFSTLAGFVEPGESLEAAVTREVFEEAGVRVLEATYHSSQPWPFPSSIMLGFFARAEASEPTVDPEEIETARWFARDELRDAVERRELKLPAPLSIARRLVEDWLEG
jgi:NAD+ diphosphatase